MTSEVSVYLAGPILHDPLADRWRESLIQSNNYGNMDLVNPLDVEEFDKEEVTPEDIVEADLEAIEGCDAVLVRWKNGIETAGTPMEMFFAREQGKFTVTWYQGDFEELSPWVRFFSDAFATSGREALTTINKRL